MLCRSRQGRRSLRALGWPSSQVLPRVAVLGIICFNGGSQLLGHSPALGTFLLQWGASVSPGAGPLKGAHLSQQGLLLQQKAPAQPGLPFPSEDFKTFFYLCIFWLCWLFVAVHRLSVVVASGGYSLQWLIAVRGLESADSVAVVHGLNCFEVCGIFPDRGWKLHWKADSLPLSHQGSPLSRVSLLQGFSGPLTCVVLQEGDGSRSISKAFRDRRCLCSRRLLRGCTVRNVVQELWLREPAPDLDLLTRRVPRAPGPSSPLQPG